MHNVSESSFASLGLSEHLLKAVQYAGYESPTAIQSQVIPLILEGKDVIAQSQTGTGKTASFCLPILQLLEHHLAANQRTIHALILTPTRELAMQVNSVVKTFARQLPKPFRSTLIVGGANLNVQLRSLMHGTDLIVATPGRLLDIVQRQNLDLSALKFFVVDEADKMLSLGFAEELELVLDLLPKKKQSLLFSATIGDKIQSITHQFMPDAVVIKTDATASTVEQVTQRAIEVNRNKRKSLLLHLIQTERWPQALIFVARTRDCDLLASRLNGDVIKAKPFHAGLTQTQRNKVLDDFKNARVQVLVATDLAARGIDIDQLPVVVNYDLPRSADDYLHRIGRTARAGEAGTAITLIGHEDKHHFALIEKRTRMRLSRESIQGFELTGESSVKVKGKPPVKGLRMSKKDKARLAAAKKER